MPTVQIKDEARIGTEARIKLEPSSYLQKLSKTGTPDLAWMDDHGEWGMRAVPGNLGLRLKDIAIGSYGVVPEHGAAHNSMAPRGSSVPSDVPALGFTVNDKAECWADNVMELYEEAVARQWSSARDIPWDELKPLPDDLERAMCQLCTFLTEVEFIAADAPTRWMSRINHDFLEVKLFLATQAMDEARHTDVFRKRALANGGGLGKSSALAELSLKRIFDAGSFSAQTARLHLLGEGFVLTMFRQGEFIAPSRVDQEIFRRCMQDESRHVGYGTMHLRTQLKMRPDLAEEVHAELDDAESILLQTFSVPESVEPMAVLMGGGIKNFDHGMELQGNLWRRIVGEYLQRCDSAGLDRRPRCILPTDFGALMAD
ncbi:MAG: ferritin-like domain-containing protein [Candidatus Binataceae bacterium]|nr:ferritin-like domain-containing protein [Candidatus Binataceae bacterium]